MEVCYLFFSPHIETHQCNTLKVQSMTRPRLGRGQGRFSRRLIFQSLPLKTPQTLTTNPFNSLCPEISRVVFAFFFWLRELGVFFFPRCVWFTLVTMFGTWFVHFPAKTKRKQKMQDLVDNMSESIPLTVAVLYFKYGAVCVCRGLSWPCCAHAIHKCLCLSTENLFAVVRL